MYAKYQSAQCQRASVVPRAIAKFTNGALLVALLTPSGPVSALSVRAGGPERAVALAGHNPRVAAFGPAIIGTVTDAAGPRVSRDSCSGKVNQ